MPDALQPPSSFSFIARPTQRPRLASTLLRKGSPSDFEVPDNAAHAYLAAAGLVLFMALIPPDAPDGLAEVFAPPILSGWGIRRIWPNPRKQYFPLETVPDDHEIHLTKFCYS